MNFNTKAIKILDNHYGNTRDAKFKKDVANFIDCMGDELFNLLKQYIKSK